MKYKYILYTHIFIEFYVSRRVRGKTHCNLNHSRNMVWFLLHMFVLHLWWYSLLFVWLIHGFLINIFLPTLVLLNGILIIITTIQEVKYDGISSKLMISFILICLLWSRWPLNPRVSWLFCSLTHFVMWKNPYQFKGIVGFGLPKK